VAAIDVNEAALDWLARERPSVSVFPVDVTDAPAVASVVAEVERRFGAIELVINAAGVMPTGLLLDQPPEEIRRVMDVNYSGTVNVTLAALPRMAERRRGDVMNFASVAAWVPALHFGAYAASNAALATFTEVLAHENRRSGVRFVCVCPGKVRTPLLAQAKSRPQILERGAAPMEPEVVLAAAGRALERGRLFAYPGWRTALAVRLRRFAPRVVWALDHWVEGE
jgi:NAD(P)-dependent dehydrogenase (short-subunit alcohol dehydrogenase family)